MATEAFNFEPLWPVWLDCIKDQAENDFLIWVARFSGQRSEILEPSPKGWVDCCVSTCFSA